MRSSIDEQLGNTKDARMCIAFGWLVFICGFAPVALAQRPSSKLLIDTDQACNVTVDGRDIGIVTPSSSQEIPVSPGQHIVKATVEDAPDLTWRKVVEA